MIAHLTVSRGGLLGEVSPREMEMSHPYPFPMDSRAQARLSPLGVQKGLSPQILRMVHLLRSVSVDMLSYLRNISGSSDYHRLPLCNDEDEKLGEVEDGQVTDIPLQGGRRKAAHGAKVHPTAWLDGLRGIAAFIVVIHHMTIVWFSWNIHDGYGINSASNLVIQLPIVRLLISGFPHVATFFVVSGYALSLKALKLMHKGSINDARSAIASSVFRRHPRLFIPALGLCIPSVIISYFGWYGNGLTLGANPTMAPPMLPLVEQLKDFFRMGVIVANPFTTAPAENWTYNPVLWTMPYEFRCSLFIYGTLLAFSGTHTLVRLGLVSIVLYYAVAYAWWDIWLFFSGMFLADLKLYMDSREFSNEDSFFPQRLLFQDHPYLGRAEELYSRARKALERFRACVMFWKIFWIVAYFACLFIMSMPLWDRGAPITPGFITLSTMVPSMWFVEQLQDKFWSCIGAACLLLCIDRSPILQTLYTNRIAQFLGKISFSLYLTHVAILHSMGFHLSIFILGLTGWETTEWYTFGIMVSGVLTMIVIVWVSFLGWLYVDDKAVKFCGWLYGKLTREERPRAAGI
ncbi:acyltransferase family-domain-containing protein [Xylariales sp. PMI_506]|nr:acyltransferase family-domain-containing protein [Xylariales sp. PMI_506]